jgi:hypothetical protein
MRISYYPVSLAAEMAIMEQIEYDEDLCAERPPLVKLAPAPWRSLGGYLDYTDWPEQERFMELDLAIKTRQESMLPLHGEDRIPQPRRCRANSPNTGNCNAIVTLSEDYDGWKCEAHRTRFRGPCGAPSPASLQTPGDQAGLGRVAKVEPSTLENLRLALLAGNGQVAQGGLTGAVDAS